MDDFEVLKKIIKKEISIDNLEFETIERLTRMCETRLKDVERQIKEKKEQLQKLEKIINKYNK